MIEGKPRVGVSSCLLGEPVRWDGRDKRSAAVADALGARFEWVAVCPEVELGLGVPREPIRLAGDPASPRLVGERSRADHTDAMRRWAEARLAALELDGFILKSRSPSCGLARVPVDPAGGGPPVAAGAGAFARAVVERLPGLPVVEETDLEDRARREQFVEQVVARRRARG